ncbi:MAG: ATP-binding protein, partial [Synechococcus sp. MOX_bin13]|nr:ATP-binding protein [Synechococcus sp. MOX_bin13]
SRTRSNRSGSGLGLAIVHQIAVNHGGRIEARNHPAGGACMDLLLPREPLQ